MKTLVSYFVGLAYSPSRSALYTAVIINLYLLALCNGIFCHVKFCNSTALWPLLCIVPSVRLYHHSTSMYSNNILITNCFLVVKTDGSNKGQDERKEEESKEKDKGDPAKFLKDKLSNITAQLQG